MTLPRAVVTGATGFVGRHLVRHLNLAGWEVHAIVRPGADLSALASRTAEITRHEYLGTTESMVGILADAKPDAVFHLASLFISEHKPQDIEAMIRSNLLFGTQLLEAMALNDTRTLVNTGTSWQHFGNLAYSPVNLYAATKEAFEAILQYYIEAHGLSVITLKLSDTYGPDDPRPKLIQLLQRVAHENAPLAMSPGEQSIDLLHIDDVTRAFVLAAKRLQAGLVSGHERWAVCSQRPITLRKLVSHVESILGHSLSINWGARPYRAREVMQTWLGELLPSWTPNIPLDIGLREVLQIRCDPNNSEQAVAKDEVPAPSAPPPN